MYFRGCPANIRGYAPNVEFVASYLIITFL